MANKHYHNLDSLLDAVRSEYYADPYMKRPSIRWSKDMVTGAQGTYNYYDNSIEISRILDSSTIDEETIKLAIHHENIHQTFSDHDSSFTKIERQFKNYEQCSEKLDDFADEIHANIEYSPEYNSSTKGKKRLVYILLNGYGEDYPNAFRSRDFKMIIDCKCKPDFEPNSKDDLYVFLVRLRDNTALVVGWCTEGNLLNTPVEKKYRKYGDENFFYQFVSKYGMVYVLFPICTSYKIPLEAFPPDFKRNAVCAVNIDDTSIKEDIDYINGYCEGFIDIGFNEQVIENVPDFRDDITVKNIQTVLRREKDYFRRVWIWNALCKLEPTDENLFLRALDKKEAWLLSSSLEDLLTVYNHGYKQEQVAAELIKLYAIMDEPKKANELWKRHFSNTSNFTDGMLVKCYLELVECKR